MFPTLIELVDNTLFCEDTAFFSELATTIISLSCDTKLSDGCFKTEIYDIFPKKKQDRDNRNQQQYLKFLSF